MAYTSKIAEVCSLEDNIDDAINVGHVTDEAARWWMAILAPDQGWKATLSQDQYLYLSPRSVTVGGSHQFKVGFPCMSLAASTPSTPPSSQQALKFFAEFCTLHGVRSQLYAALTAVIMLPIHNYYGTDAVLPFPAVSNCAKPLRVKMNTDELYKHLPYYMALSCHRNVVVSSVCGVFWEPHVACNMVSPWLHPVLVELQTQSRYIENDTWICWQWISSPRPRRFLLDWLPQSFMDTPGSGPYATTVGISRADVWRLLYLPPVVEDDLHYNTPPFTPWEPIGRKFRSTDHQLIYQPWLWLRSDAPAIEDKGLNMLSPPAVSNHSSVDFSSMDFQTSPLRDQKASMEASREAFGWVTRNGEGKPPEDVYWDKWLQEGSDDSDGETPEFSDGNDQEGSLTDIPEAGLSIQMWVNKVK
ncbi:hypothetical protein ACJ73_03699 [Blastomyces percursus]|uniref:Uncharacterized protein n=1 Tax=Blastomyces percursus TaxID=1658174 RepID=A0A1J9QA46_9EURO|nr:hypothetical protein ACJ73_03699 [Blastomyces percursus]